MPTLVISTVPLNVVCSKTLLAFRGRGASNTAAPYLTKSRRVPTVVISTVPLNVVCSKTLLAFRGTGASNTAALRRSQTGKRLCAYFSRPGYQQEYLPFPDVAGNRRHARRVPSDVGNGQSIFGRDTMRRSGDIRARAEASAIGGKRRRRGRSQEDDRGLTFELNEFGVRERNSAEIGLAVFERRSYVRAHRQTDTQTPLLYISNI